MSTPQSKLTQIDPSERPTVGRKVFAEGEPRTLDSEYSCILTNDTNNTYIVFLLHDNGWLAELWGQPPGMNVAIPPTWKFSIMPTNGGDAVKGDTHGNQTYYGCWGTTTQADRTFYFSKMSY